LNVWVSIEAKNAGPICAHVLSFSVY